MVINGKKIAEEIMMDVRRGLERLSFKPVFCDVIVGDDPVSLSFVKIKGRTAERGGFSFKMVQLPSRVSQEELLNCIEGLNGEPGMCGLIVQLPLPANLEKQVVLDAISPELDVDCIGSVNSKKFYETNHAEIEPPTALAVLETLKNTGVILEGKKIVIVGKGALVGKPVERMLLKRGLSASPLDKHSENFYGEIKSADVLICGTGQPRLISGDMIKQGSVVIDAGTSETDGGISGDVDFESVSRAAAWVSPVPGGVGPVTVAKLLENVLRVAQRK